MQITTMKPIHTEAGERYNAYPARTYHEHYMDVKRERERAGVKMAAVSAEQVEAANERAEQKKRSKNCQRLREAVTTFVANEMRRTGGEYHSTYMAAQRGFPDAFRLMTGELDAANEALVDAALTAFANRPGSGSKQPEPEFRWPVFPYLPPHAKQSLGLHMHATEDQFENAVRNADGLKPHAASTAFTGIVEGIQFFYAKGTGEGISRDKAWSMARQKFPTLVAAMNRKSTST